MDSMKGVIESLDTVIANLESSISVADLPAASPSGGDPADATTSAGDAVQKQKKKKEKKTKTPAPTPIAPEIAQFLQCDLRVGRVAEVGFHPEADGLYVLKVSYGEDEVRTVCAGLRKFIPEEEMASRMVVTICNLKPRKLRGVDSEAMILAGSVVSGEGEKETVVPIGPPAGAKEGAVVSADGMVGERTVVAGKYVSGKVWDKVGARLGVKGKLACYDGAALTVAGTGHVACALPDGAEIH